MMPIVEEPRFAGFIARMMELTSTVTPWHRRLWRSGTIQLGRELLGDSVRPGVREAALSDQGKYWVRALRTDHGIKDHGRRVEKLVKELKPGVTESSHTWITVREHLDRMNDSYLECWAEALESPPQNRPVDTEGAARRITAHLIDSGMHKSSIFSWLTAAEKSTDSVSISDLIISVDYRLKRPKREYTFCVPIQSKPRFEITSENAPGWLNATSTSRWKKQNSPRAQSIRHQGSFLITINARDVNAAAEEARDQISRLSTKFSLGTETPITIAPLMWSKDKNSDFPTQSTNRLISFRAFERLEKLQSLEMDDYIANTLALIQPLRTSDPHIAVMSGWSAIESLMIGPTDDHDNVASSRFSLIVAASMVRAELTKLSISYMTEHSDSTAEEIRSCSENIDRAKIFQMRAASPEEIAMKNTVDNLALSRIKATLSNPKSEIEKISGILNREFLRMYRKRNMIVHGGQIHDNNLHSITDLLTPLIGAGVDRIVHAGLKYGVKPIELSAVAESRLEYLEATTASNPGNILDLLEF